MCGIAGLLGVPAELARAAAPRMLAAMRHRGPDDQGIVVLPSGRSAPAMLLHARLAILDLTSAGHQPMPDAPQDAKIKPNWVVFNGEVFNFLELHDPLAAKGWPCRTRCDTEVILHAYRVWGESCVERFRGMFAWCLIDSERGTAWFCRDRLGIKPLYLFRPAAGGLLFASEVRTLLAAGPELVPPQVNPSALESFLAQGAVSGSETVIDGIDLLSPGHSLVTDWSGKPIQSRTYWQIAFAGKAENSVDRKRAVVDLGESLREAVKLRLIADVPLGLFLSGGIDSGALAAIATEVAGTRVQTISIGFDQPEFDETETAALVAKALGTEHRSLRLTGQDVLDDLPLVLEAVDQPTVDGFNTFFVSRAARRAGLTVALSGLGGDELFGGYASFRDVPRALRWQKRLRWAGYGRRLIAGVMRWTGRRGGAKAAEMLVRSASPLQLYLLRRELFLPRERRALQDLPHGSDPFSGVPRAMLHDLKIRAKGLEPVHQVSLFELGAYMRHMLLRDADVFSMTHGLEVRVPLLDHRVVEQVAALPSSYKQPDPRPKSLLVDAVGKRLPAAVSSLPKRGFTFPWEAWLRGPLRKRATRALENRDLWLTLGLNASAPVELWQRFQAKDRRVSPLQVLGLVVLENYAVRHGLRRAA